MLHPIRLNLVTIGLQSDTLLTELIYYVQVRLKVSDLQAMSPDEILLEARLCRWNFL